MSKFRFLAKKIHEQIIRIGIGVLAIIAIASAIVIVGLITVFPSFLAITLL